MRRSEAVETQFRGKTVVLCLGNRYLKDDAVGIRVADQLANRDLGDEVVVDSHQSADLSLLARYSGAKKVVVVDALLSGLQPGTVSRFTISPRLGPVLSLPGEHSMGLHDTLDFARQSRLLTCPVTIIGIEPGDSGVGEGLSTDVERSIAKVLSEVAWEVNSG